MQQDHSQHNQTPQALVEHLIRNWEFDSCNREKLVKIAEVLFSTKETKQFAQYFFVHHVEGTLKNLSAHKPEDVLDQILSMTEILVSQKQTIFNISQTFQSVLPAILKAKDNNIDLEELPKIANSVAELLNFFEQNGSKDEAKPIEVIHTFFTEQISRSNSDFDLNELVQGTKDLLSELKLSGYSQVATNYFIKDSLNKVREALDIYKNKTFSPSTQFKIFAQSISQLREAGATTKVIDAYFQNTLPAIIVGAEKKDNYNKLISTSGVQTAQVIKNLLSKRYQEDEIRTVLIHNIPIMAEYGFLSNETSLTRNLKVVEILHYQEMTSLSVIKNLEVDPYSLISCATGNSNSHIPISIYARTNEMDLELLASLQRSLRGNNQTRILQTIKVCDGIYRKTFQKAPYSVLALMNSIALHLVDNAHNITDDLIDDIVNLYSEKLLKTNPVVALKEMKIQIRGSSLMSEFRYIFGALDAASEYFSEITYLARKTLGQDGHKSPFAEFLDRISIEQKPLKYKFDKYPGNGFLIEQINLAEILPLVTSEGIPLIDGVDHELSKIKTLRIIHFRGFLIINNPELNTEEKSLLILNDHIGEHVNTKSLSFLVENKEVDNLISDIKSGRNLPENLQQFLNYFPPISISLYAGINHKQRIDFASLNIFNNQDPRIYYSTLSLVKTLWIYNLAFSQYKKGAAEEVTGSEYDSLNRMYHIAKQAHDVGFKNIELRVTNTFFGKKHRPNNLPSVDLTSGQVYIDDKETTQKFDFEDIEKDLALFRELFFPFWATPHLQLNITNKE